MKSSLTTHLAWAILLASSAVTLYQGVGHWQVAHTNGQIAAIAAGGQAAPEVQLAQALRLKRQQRYGDALAVLSRILAQGGTPLQVAVRYDLGNVYLRQALGLIDSQRPNDALPLLNLAKQAYRQALALDSGFWDAKYNLDVAMRLLPELERLDAPEDPQAQPQVPLWTRVPGLPRGLP
jgi:mxaK protein